MKAAPAASLALLLLSALLAGCSNPQQDTLRAVYGGDFDATSKVPLIHGAHLEARLPGGTWGDTVAATAQAPAFTGPAMPGPAPQGGGGDRQRLPGVNATVEVRIKEAARLGGLTAHWFVTDNGSAPADLAAAQATLPGDGTFQAALTQPGPFAVVVVLTGSSVDATQQATYEPLHGRLTATWTATGQVQPVAAPPPPVGTPPTPTPRDQMVDRYDLDVRPGAHLQASTVFDGQFSGSQGTDIDVGLYRPDQSPAVCSASGGSPTPVGPSPVPDPSQASESAATDANPGGAWSVQVGAQENGCNSGGGTTYQYANGGPVPYKLTVVAG